MDKLTEIPVWCPLFQGLSKGQTEEILRQTPHRIESFERGRVLYKADDESGRIGVILSGCLEMRKYLPSGNVLSLFQRRKGELLGGSIVFSGTPRYPCEVAAREDTEILWFEKEQVFEMLMKHSVIAANILRISADRIKQLERRVELFSLFSIQKKIAFSLIYDFVSEKNEIVLPFSKTTWAEYLNVSRPSLCRELKHLSVEGVIKTERNKIYILQKDRLEGLLYQ